MLSSYPLNYLQWEYGQESGKEGFPYGSAGKESAYNVGDLGLIPGLGKSSGKGKGFPGGAELKASACNVGDLGSVPGSGRSPGEGNGTLLQYSCLENPLDGGAWWATVHGSQRVRHN